jgi:hypothetical protein
LSGKRTIGCCSHISSIIYYLSFGRYNPEFQKTTQRDFLVPVILESSDDERIHKTEKSKKSLKSKSSKRKKLKKNKSNVSNNDNVEDVSLLSFREISSHIPSWGCYIDVNELDYDNKSSYEQFKIYDKFELVNSCTIDYHLMSLWLSWKYFSKGMTKAIEENRENPQISSLIKIISLIDNFEWDRARTIWTLDINKMVLDEYCRFNAFGTEFEYFVKHMREFQKYKILCECGKMLYNLGDLQFKKIGEKCVGNWEDEGVCNVWQTSNAKLSFEN